MIVKLEVGTLRNVEKQLIVLLLKHYGGARNLVAKHLGVDLKTLYNKIVKYKVKIKRMRAANKANPYRLWLSSFSDKNVALLALKESKAYRYGSQEAKDRFLRKLICHFDDKGITVK